jgi:hypothetical protein
MTPQSFPALERLHPRLVAVVCPPATNRTLRSRPCASCGGDLTWQDTVSTACGFCGARNFMSDALRASLFGRTAPWEVLVLLGAEGSRRLPEGEDAWRVNAPLLVEGEPVLLESS